MIINGDDSDGLCGRIWDLSSPPDDVVYIQHIL